MAYLILVATWISYKLKTSLCTYAPKPNLQGERQLICALYLLWLYTHGFFFLFLVVHTHRVLSPSMLYDYHPN